MINQGLCINGYEVEKVREKKVKNNFEFIAFFSVHLEVGAGDFTRSKLCVCGVKKKMFEISVKYTSVTIL